MTVREGATRMGKRIFWRCVWIGAICAILIVGFGWHFGTTTTQRRRPRPRPGCFRPPLCPLLHRRPAGTGAQATAARVFLAVMAEPTDRRFKATQLRAMGAPDQARGDLRRLADDLDVEAWQQDRGILGALPVPTQARRCEPTSGCRHETGVTSGTEACL
jgi:hypothetical protein